MRIIPAIDIIDGKCVRLTKGDYDTQKIYSESPLEIAKQYEQHGVQYLHLVDLDGAKSRHIVNHKVLEEIASKTSLKVDFGGGLKSDEDLKVAFESGANQVTGGSIAIEQPEVFIRWIEKFGGERIILGADCLDRKIATNGWLNTSDTDVMSFIKHYEERGIHNVICTDISKDGMLMGPSFSLYEDILENSNVNLIASGGIRSVEDLTTLQKLGCTGAIIGKAIYEGLISLEQLKELC